MDDLFRKILFIAGYVFAGLLIAFTSLQTYALLFEVSGSAITAVIGLILFEAGMIYWWSVFRREAEGLFQMAISGLMFVISLALVTTAVALHLGAVTPDFFGPHTPARIIILAALLNLVAKLIYPIVHPDVFEEINDRAQEGKILGKAEKLYNKKVDDIAAELADEMAEIRANRARARIYEDFSTRLNRRLPNGKEDQPRPIDPTYGTVTLPELRQAIDRGDIPMLHPTELEPTAHPNGRAGENGIGRTTDHH